MKLEKEEKKYYRQIRSLLFVSTARSKAFFSEFAESVDRFVAENNVTDIADVRAKFGEPEEIAKAFLAESDLYVVKKKLRIRRIVVALVLIVLLIWSAFSAYYWIDLIYANHHAYLVDYPPMSEEELATFQVEDYTWNGYSHDIS